MQVLEKMIAQDQLWDNPDQARIFFKERGKILNALSEWEQTQAQFEEAEILYDLALEEADRETLSEVRLKLGILEKILTQMEFNKLLSGEDDVNNAIMAIHAGAGGTEAQDWAEMLLRMYLRWSERGN